MDKFLPNSGNDQAGLHSQIASISLGELMDQAIGFAETITVGEQFYYCIQGVDKPSEPKMRQTGIPGDFLSRRKWAAARPAGDRRKVQAGK